MLSLYIHIPFCDRKCWYCSFHVFESGSLKEENSLISSYVNWLMTEIKDRWQKLFDEKWEKEEIWTIYIGWGTPPKVWENNLIRIIDQIEDSFSLKYLSELTIECNPEPADEILAMVESMNRRCKTFPRVRYSLGIQSFDDEILQWSWRGYSFNKVVGFLRELQKLKESNVCYNFDFIAFGKFKQLKNGNSQLWNDNKIEFFKRLMKSHVADSVSVYTLELFPGSQWYYERKTLDSLNKTKEIEKKEKLWPYSDFFGSDDEVYDEFSFLKDMILASGYKRYELSNFALSWKSSIHNRIYREMWNYLWLWTSAASFAKKWSSLYACIKKDWIVDIAWWVRWTNTKVVWEYLKGETIAWWTLLELSEKDLLIEHFFLSLRTDFGVRDLSIFASVLVADYEEIVWQLKEQWFVFFDGKKLQLTGMGMDVFNEIVTSLLEEV